MFVSTLPCDPWEVAAFPVAVGRGDQGLESGDDASRGGGGRVDGESAGAVAVKAAASRRTPKCANGAENVATAAAHRHDKRNADKEESDRGDPSDCAARRAKLRRGRKCRAASLPSKLGASGMTFLVLGVEKKDSVSGRGRLRCSRRQRGRRGRRGVRAKNRVHRGRGCQGRWRRRARDR